MSSYPKRVWDNILPLSVGNNLPEAFEEWSFADVVRDHGQATETCELCDQESLRYQFEIRNEHTGRALWVGSQCILRFGVSVFEAGRKLSIKDTQKKLDRLTQKMRDDACLRSVHKLADAEGGSMLANAVRYYQSHGYLSPKFAFVVLWRLKENGIEHSPSFFKIALRRDQHKKDLQEMKLSNVHMIWPALSSSQREQAIRLGHRPPPPPLSSFPSLPPLPLS